MESEKKIKLPVSIEVEKSCNEVHKGGYEHDVSKLCRPVRVETHDSCLGGEDITIWETIFSL